MRKFWLAVILCLSLLAPTLRVLALTQVIYADALGTGWDSWSWAQVNLASTTRVHTGTHSIAVTFDVWEGLYLHKAGVETLGYTHLRFFIHGGNTGGQHMDVFLNLEVGGNPQNGPAVDVPLPPANAWLEVQMPLSSLNPGGATVTGITWQESSGQTWPAVYFDDIALTSNEDPNGPQLSQGYAHPRSLPADGEGVLVVRANVTDPQGAGDIAAVTLDGSSLGLGSIPLHDDGRSNDGGVNDGLYGAAVSIPLSAPSGERSLLISASDLAGHTANLPLGVFVVLTSPGGTIPSSLPVSFGWGSNAWDETPGQDWQENSSVPWDYVYQYITWGWETWGGSFVYRFVHQAWNKGFIPMVVVYNMLGAPNNCGEGGTCYAQKLQNASTVQNYLASLERAAQEANGASPVIFNIEPDFYGFMQQLSNSGSPPPGVVADDPASYPVALNKNGYPNNLSGFGRYIVDRIHALAPNTLVAPMASMWATNRDPQSATTGEAITMGERTAAFIDAMGGAQADLLVVEWSDRDAGSGLRPWWDDADRELPRPTRAILWENVLSQASGKRLLLWQVPVGNMSLNNTCDHYRDNRAAYLFNHPRDLFEAGVIGVLFGGGATCMTGVETDGGFVAAQGAIAYANPASPGGLAASAPNGNLASLHWTENTEPDLWKYRVLYRLLPSGAQHALDVGRRNARTLVLPQTGTWEIRLTAVDAMGNESAPSAALDVTISTDAEILYLPAVWK